MKFTDYADRLLRLDTKDIALLRYIFEGHEGIANTTTMDDNPTMVRIRIVPDFVEEADAILDALREEICFEICEANSR
ncbi:MAG: DUF4911 domain-containing protein [Syntrophales bacterium]|nr:DUF4911 domain-containing protein [Syntrophales bacterium]